MTLIRFYNPDLFNRDENVNEAYNRWMERFNNGGMVPAANVSETDTAYGIEMALPGVDKNQIRVEHEKGFLTIRVENTSKDENEKNGYARKEFDFSGASRTFRTGEKVDAENITARYENGILTVYLPKKEQYTNKPAKMISIE
jgi:HSP20 family protein